MLYPGLPGHPGHDIAKRQMNGFGTVVTFEVADEPAARLLCSSTQVFALAVSLGAVESLIEHPAQMTHTAKAGSDWAIAANLVRLSIGLEDVEDLIGDLEQALAIVSSAATR